MVSPGVFGGVLSAFVFTAVLTLIDKSLRYRGYKEYKNKLKNDKRAQRIELEYQRRKINKNSK